VNKLHASRAVAVYNGAVEDLNAEELAQLRESAEAYNAQLADNHTSFNLTDEQEAEYKSQLSLSNTSVMATLEISELGVSLPIYHGTEDTVLQVGIGHLAGSSLPVGGASTHTVLMGHRGLPSARLLTDLDKMRVGDTFCVTTLGEKLWYEVDQILIVEPNDTSALGIVEGEDLCTLVTCTPYGVNSHRLLVRGHRVDDPNSGTMLTADAYTIDPVIVASIMAIPVLLVCVIVAATKGQKRRQSKRKK
jgi:sortase A